MPKAVQYERFGDPSVLEVVEVPQPVPGEGKVRVAVRAAGLNWFDHKMRSGLVPLADPKFPRGIGGDFSGVVAEVGDGAVYFDGERVRVGDEVLGWGDRVMREQLIVSATNLARKPSSVPWAEAAALSTPVQTANAALDAIDLVAGDVVLMSAAAGGVGFVAAQLAQLRGARVIGTSSPASFPVLESVGVTPVAYGPGLAERVLDAAAGAGLGPVTAVQDNFGREALDAGVALAVPPHRMVTIADQEAAEELGVPVFGNYQRSAALLQDAAQLVADGALRIELAGTFPLGDVVGAFTALQSRPSGRLVLVVSP